MATVESYRSENGKFHRGEGPEVAYMWTNRATAESCWPSSRWKDTAIVMINILNQGGEEGLLEREPYTNRDKLGCVLNDWNEQFTSDRIAEKYKDILVWTMEETMIEPNGVDDEFEEKLEG